MQWSERPPAARSPFPWLGHRHFEPGALSVAVAHFILVRPMRAYPVVICLVAGITSTLAAPTEDQIKQWAAEAHDACATADPRARVDLEFASTYQARPPDTFHILVKLKDGDVYEPDLEYSYYIDERGRKTVGLNVIEQNYDEYKWYGYDKRHYILTVPRPLTDIGHFFPPGHHRVTFYYVLNGHRRKATLQCTIQKNER